MYKVFVNDCLIILTENNNLLTKLSKVNFDEVDIFNWVIKNMNGVNSGICLVCNNLELDWNRFKSYFNIQKAAGGKVLNLNEEVLFIYRFDKWDLPKGKLEKGESIQECAIREVEEECGITNLSIINELETTYHIFKRNEKMILKVTYWFLMRTNYSGNLTPQEEEGIDKVVFKNASETSKALQNTYQNIKLLF